MKKTPGTRKPQYDLWEDIEPLLRAEANEDEKLIDEKVMSQAEARELLDEIKKVTALCATPDGLEETLVAAKKMQAVRTIISESYPPDITLPFIILDIVKIAEPDPKKQKVWEFHAGGSEEILDWVRSFCEFDGTEDDWDEAVTMARIIQIDSTLAAFFDQIMAEKIARLEQERQASINEIRAINTEIANMVPWPLFSNEIVVEEA